MPESDLTDMAITDNEQERAARRSNLGMGEEGSRARPQSRPYQRRFPVPSVPVLDSSPDYMYLGGLMVLGATTIIEWPIAAAIGVGYLLARRPHIHPEQISS